MNNGYEKVFNMRDGLNKWIKKGFPTKGNNISFLANNGSNHCCSTSEEKASSTSSCCDNNSESSCC